MNKAGLTNMFRVLALIVEGSSFESRTVSKACVLVIGQADSVSPRWSWHSSTDMLMMNNHSLVRSICGQHVCSHIVLVMHSNWSSAFFKNIPNEGGMGNSQSKCSRVVPESVQLEKATWMRTVRYLWCFVSVAMEIKPRVFCYLWTISPAPDCVF